MTTKKTGATTLQGSKRARQIAVAILEALSGEVGTSEAAELLGVSLSRYYQLEMRALTGLLDALEPRTRGPQKSPRKTERALTAEIARLQKELRRHQALLRAAHRSMGVKAYSSKQSDRKKGSRKGRHNRGQTVLQTLREEPVDTEGNKNGAKERDAGAGRPGRSQPAGA